MHALFDPLEDGRFVLYRGRASVRDNQPIRGEHSRPRVDGRVVGVLFTSNGESVLHLEDASEKHFALRERAGEAPRITIVSRRDTSLSGVEGDNTELGSMLSERPRLLELAGTLRGKYGDDSPLRVEVDLRLERVSARDATARHVVRALALQGTTSQSLLRAEHGFIERTVLDGLEEPISERGPGRFPVCTRIRAYSARWRVHVQSWSFSVTELRATSITRRCCSETEHVAFNGSGPGPGPLLCHDVVEDAQGKSPRAK